MELTLARYDGLLQLLRLLDYPCRILLAHTHQDFHHLLSISLILRLDRPTELRIRIFDEVKTIVTPLAIQRVATTHIFQLHGGANITSYHLRHRNSVLSGHREDLCDTLLRASIGIRQVIALFHFS